MQKLNDFIRKNNVDLNTLPSELKEAILSLKELKIEYESIKSEHNNEAKKLLTKINKASDHILTELVELLDNEAEDEKSSLSQFLSILN